jgi:curved DNA-binding protein
LFSGLGDLDIDDLLGGFFGRTGGGRGAGRGPRATDVEAEVLITVEEAFSGTRRRITLSGPEGERTIDVSIPAGVADGQRVRVPAQGGEGSDLYLIARIQPHPRFRLDGRDVSVDLLLTPWEAALGAKVPVDAPGGEAKVTVPAGSSSGRRLRLKGQGLPDPRGQPGDLYAEVKIMVPKRPSAKERELFEELRRVSDFDPRTRR